MGIRHKSLPIEGVQFHPESVLTPDGPRILARFLRRCGEGEPEVLESAARLLLQGPEPGRSGMSEQSALGDRGMRGGSLSVDEAHAAMASVMEGEATPAQLGGLLLALRMRGEKVDELTGFAKAMRERVVPVQAPDGAIDTCGTGGDGSKTFNISTASALVVAAAGVPVAKHGNRAMSSATGSADVLEALGIPIDLAPTQPPKPWRPTASRSCSHPATTPR